MNYKVNMPEDWEVKVTDQELDEEFPDMTTYKSLKTFVRIGVVLSLVAISLAIYMTIKIL